ncbi:hypothetical protein B0H10DRAFT_1968424 [Mycena sp. CBHHK59/15]|nr:hypothetical protein B0H10DRAFT_1968424 [Mycena sp. CBHHK59/15]
MSFVPLARTDDFLSTFATNPSLSILEGEDPWESFVHDQIDSLLVLPQSATRRNAVQLSEIIRHGPLGMAGFYKWLRACLFELNVPAGVFEHRVERIISAMIILGSVKSITPPADEELEAPLEKTAAKLIPQASGCSGQVFPVAEGKEPHLALALGLHAARQLPWSLTFGENIILRSDNCRGHAQISGVCTPCEKLLRNQTIKGMIERNADGFRTQHDIFPSHNGGSADSPAKEEQTDKFSEAPRFESRPHFARPC